MSKKPSRYKWIAGSVLALAAALFGAVALLLQEPGRQRQRLPDGQLLELLGTTYGRWHMVPALGKGEALRLTLGSWLADLRSGRWPRPHPIPRAAPYPTGNPALLLWLRYTWSAHPGRIALQHAEPVDEHGCRFPGASEWVAPLPGGSGPSPLGRVQSEELDVFPRRGGTVTLGYYNYPENRLVGRFSVANPVAGPYPVWQAPPYPVTARNGDLELQVTGMRHREPRGGFGSGAVYRVLRQSRPAGWVPVAAEVSDATGNRHRRPVHLEGDVAWFDGLCVKESAWKLRIELAPKGPEPEAAQSWTTPALPLPETGRRHAAPASWARDGAMLRVVSVEGWPSTGWERSPQARVQVEETLSPETPDRGLRTQFLAVTDDQGRPGTPLAGMNVEPTIPFRGGLPQTQRRVRYYRFHVRLRPGARAFRLTLGCAPTRTIELLARP